MAYTEEQIKSGLRTQLLAGKITKDQASDKMAKFRNLQQSGTPDLGLPASAQDINNPMVGAMSGAVDVQPQMDTTAQPEQQDYGMIPTFGQVSEMITGKERSTPETENPNVEEIFFMPEMNEFSKAAGMANVATMFNGDANERAKIIKSNFPNIELSTDGKGNNFYKSANGKIYKDSPGFGPTDIPRTIAMAGLGAAEGLAGGASVLGQVIASITTELGNEAFQYFAGGNKPDYANVAVSGALAGAPGAAKGAKNMAGDAFEQMVTPKGMGDTMTQAIPEAVYNPRSINLTPNKPITRIDKIRMMIDQGDEAGLAKAAQETPEAFQTAQMKGGLKMGKAKFEEAGKAFSVKDNLAEAPTESIQKDIGTLAREATTSKSKKKKFAMLAKQNKEAIEASNRTKILVPLDVTSDNPQFMAASMAPRLSDTSDASNLWSKQLKDGSVRADELLLEAGSDTANVNVSSKILGEMVSKKEVMKNDAGKFIGEVDKLVPDKTPILFFNGEVAAKEISEALSSELMSPEVRRSLKIIARGEGTYLDLGTMKENIRLAQERTPTGFFAGLDKKTIGKLDEALKADQIDNVSTIVNPEVGKALKDANISYAKSIDLEDAISDAFGSDTGSIGQKLKTALAGVGKDDRAINELMDVIPQEYHAEMLMTGIFDGARVKTSGSRLVKDKDFGFSEYSTAYKAMAKNTKFMATLQKTVGKRRMQLLKDIDEISQRVTNVRAFQTKTGKDLAPMIESMQAENLIAAFVKHPAIKTATTVATLGVNKFGAAAAIQDKATDIISTGGKKQMDAIGELFQDPVFLNFVNKASVQEIKESSAAKLAKTSTFVKFAKATGIKAPEKWIMQAIRSQPKEENK